MDHIDEFGLIRADNDNRSAQVIQIESSKLLPSIILVAVLSVGALLIGVMGLIIAHYAERESRMSEYYINILNQTLNEQNIPHPNYEDFKRTHKE